MTQKQATRKSIKTVLVLATYTFKHLPRVCFTVLASNGADKYNTCFDNGNASCTCDGFSEYHKECYHIKQLRPRYEAIMAKREQKQAQIAELDAEPVWVRMPNGTQRLAHQVNDEALNSLNEMTEQYAAEVVAHEEAKSEQKMQAFQRGMQEQYASDPRPTTSKQRQEAPLHRQGFSLMR